VRRLLAGVNWKAFGVLWVAGLLGVVAVLPYMMELVGSSTFGQAATPDIPMPLVLALALLQNGILLAVAILTGLVLSERTGLRMPLIQAWTTGTQASAALAVVLPALLTGAAVGATLIAIGRLADIRGVRDRHRVRCGAFRLGTPPGHVSHHAANDDARRARVGLERDRWHRVWVLVLEARPRSGDDRAHGCPLGNADPRGHHSDKDAVMVETDAALRDPHTLADASQP
jgi:hypothetical protein